MFTVRARWNAGRALAVPRFRGGQKVAPQLQRMEVEDFTKAIEVTRAHLPDPKDVEANLFLRDIYDFFANNRPVLSSVQGLQESVHRSVVETTEERAALVRQRAGLFGVMAVLGLVLAIIAPFMGSGLM